ncbi:chemotaxis protein CheX [Actinoplanes regularis]|uniref:Chemotaxis protein CheX n=1 Tax=Actinoplanes regularis TaxID=52697 RepID=A0A239GC17_9ACTN|nr:chemotaxis protein CheX [Actinoplanes regularis]GIE90359.1 hypothetical protein Are01nite_68390 [Actinoplanes regularis]GLW33931.1 hypothetical protein Areg01_68690 [Actinoplanes regularis]SNS66475.1 chemotaxis protein CheX [Actinoplanes regularis]
MSVEVDVDESDLAEMVEQVWESYLDPEGVSPLMQNYDHDQPTEVHSSVSITGAWNGHVVYASSRAAAQRAAAAFLAMEIDEVSEEDISDTLGELANIVGGNVKAMLPPGSQLSLPQVVLAPESTARYPSAERISGIYGTWEGEPVSISMWHASAETKEEGA